MCGIAGVVGPGLPALEEAGLAQLRETILFRGRDEQGEWSDGREAFLCQARLAIVDVEHGQQPMRTADGRYTLVFAGEIYNHLELRRTYEALGATFRTHSDTEVLLEGYRLRGPAVCEELNGMFAVAVWDAEARTLFLARDRVGKKPLFWCEADGVLAFSSSLDSFAGLPGWRGAISRGNVALYGILGAFPRDRTVYEDAHALPPASWLLVRPGDGTVRPERYWWPDFRHRSHAPLAELEERYEELLVDATRLRLRGDVPVALTFSGGIDSGSIAWACARRLDTHLRCLTIDTHTDANPSNETLVAEAAARHLDLPWQLIQFDPGSDLLDALPETYAYYDEPCSQLPLVYADRLYRAVRPHATVVLSGNGGDELFTGYVGDERNRQRDVMAAPFRPLRPLLRRIQRLPKLLRLSAPDAFAAGIGLSARERWRDPEVLAAVDQGAAELAADLHAAHVDTWLDLKMLASTFWGNRDGNFRLADISGLAAQVEVRSPFFDYRMIEFAAALPHRYKVSRLRSPEGNKFLPRTFYRKVMPAQVADAPKRGMAANIRWDRLIASDAAFESSFAAAYDELERAGLDDGGARRAWRAYVAEIRSRPGTTEYGGPETGPMMTGFMLGTWHAQRRGVPLGVA